MEFQKIINYLFISLLSGTLFYLIGVIITYLKVETRRMKIISIKAIFASVIYILGIVLLFVLQNSTLVYSITGVIYLLKFILETQMSNELHYSEKKHTIHILTVILIVSLLFILHLAKLQNNELYTIGLISINISIGAGWFLEKNLRILSINNFIAIIFLILFYQNHIAGILFSLIPYGMNSIFITSKEYTQTVRSLEKLKEKKDLIIEEQIKQFKDFLFLMINKIESRYSLRKMHSLNVAKISEGIARELKLDEKLINLIIEGAIIHDIGFLGIDHRELSTSKSYEENEEIIKHIWIGRNILERSNIFIKYLPIVLYHHERIDGSGPEGMTGEIIPLPVKIISVADKFERLINGRDSEKLSIKDAITYLKKHSGTIYDTSVVKALERYVSKRFNY